MHSLQFRIVRANALKRTQESEYNNILEQVMAKRQKKQKLNDVEDNKENTFHNSYNVLDNSSFLEYSNNDNSLSWDEKVEFELKALKDTTNIWNNSSPEYYGEDKEAIQESPTTTIESEYKLDTLTRVEQAIEQKTTQEPIVGET
ncbi:14357_t:CDS:2 [Gigaspora rosea]|nr:14357_t:CDS:2 [Gigaspora rosea]